MKKRVFLKILVALVLLTSILVSSLLGVSKAEYFKSYAKSLDFEAKPDLSLEYYLYHSPTRNKDKYEVDRGAYKNSHSFVQYIGTAAVESLGHNGDRAVSKDTKVVYQVKIPVTETGYYTLDFTSNFLLGGDTQTAQYGGTEFYNSNANYCIGCEVVTITDFVEGIDYDAFGVNTPWTMPNRIFGVDDSTKKTNSQLPLIYTDTSVKGGTGDTVYQWKTLSPFRTENVRLTFKVTEKDLTERGYVIWMWDLTGLPGGFNYTLYVHDFDVTKTMELDGTSKTRGPQDPYFMFPQTAYSNNYFEDGAGVGQNIYTEGRGTYVTEATENSLGMRAEILYDDNSSDRATNMQNPLSLYIPLKNIKYDKTYKVTFDFSVAKQGDNAVDTTKFNGWTSDGKAKSNADWHTYDVFRDIFRVDDYTSSLASSGRACWSYLYGNDVEDANLYRHSYAGHQDFMDQIICANKSYTSYPHNEYTYGYPLTKYDEVTNGFTEGYTTSTSVNDTYSKVQYVQNSQAGIHKSASRNWFNAIEHTEYNGQNAINWITFYNTTFSFNIPEEKNSGVDLNNLYWIWMIDILKYTAFYHIRIDNVRIEEVVEYGSGFDVNGVKISGVQLDQTIHSDHHDAADGNGSDLKNGVRGTFAAFRGMTGTGQNFQAKGFVLNEETSKENNQFFTNSANIYSPIIDASRFQVSDPAHGIPYEIELDGYAVCKGGINRYVYSVDGGVTWKDMVFNGTNATESQLTNAANSINQHTSGQSVYGESDYTWGSSDSRPTYQECKHSTLTTADTTNGNFSEWNLSVNLEEYQNEPNLDIIIAAVPNSNTKLRCEILRIINFNQIRNYRTYTNHFVSDISVTNTSGVESLLNAAFESNKDGNENKTFFNYMRGWETYYNNGPGSASSGYARRCSYSHAYEDIRTLFSDFPVYSKLSVTGWAIVEGGVDKYVWSVDFGKTWNDCTGTPETLGIAPEQRASWYDGVAQVDDTLAINGSFMGSGGAAFTGKNMLTADLSSYEGEVVDVIFCAKPVDSDVYVPVGRIDNVAVYGEDGTFYTRLADAAVSGTTTYKSGLILDHNDTYRQFINPGEKNATLAAEWTSKWDIGNSNDADSFAYSIFEPNNVKATNARFYTDTVYTMKSGGKISINGYVVCKGGVKHYKFSLDGGKTWTKINDAGDPGNGTLATSTELARNITYAKKYSDASFVTADAKNGCFLTDRLASDKQPSADGVTLGSDYMLSFNLPALPQGMQRNLLVVAESKSGRDIPVLHIKLQFSYSDGTSQYGYMRSEDAKTATMGWVTENQVWNFAPDPTHVTEISGINNARNRMTIPVTESGKFQLTFNHTLYNGPATGTKLSKKLYDENGNANTQNGNHKTADCKLTVNKTHFLTSSNILNEISMSFTATYNSGFSGGFGTVRIVLFSEDWLNQSGHQYALYYSDSVALMPSGGTTGTLTKTAAQLSGPNPGLPPDSIKLRPGKYTIMVIHREREVNNEKVELHDFLKYNDYRNKYVLAETSIYVHDPDEAVEFSVVHDEGKYTYFSDPTRQLTSTGVNKAANAEHIYTLTDPFLNDDSRAINATINVTPGDVERGYIILDANYTTLLSANEHTAEQCEENNITDSRTPQTPSSHTDETCVSYHPGNGSVFTKMVKGEKMYDLVNTSDKTKVVKSLYHTGMKYKATIKLGPNSLVRKVDPLRVNMSLKTSAFGYANGAFMSTADAAGNYEISMNPILNPSITKNHFNFDNGGKFNGSYLSVPKTYFNVGEPITVDYKVVGATTSNVYMYITSDQICSSGKYGDLYIKQAQLSNNSTGTIEFTKDTYDLEDSVYTGTPLVSAWANNLEGINRLRALPEGEYKIWLINDNSFDPFNMLHNKNGTNDAINRMVTEPISIKVIDPANPDISMIHRDNIPYKNQDAVVPTELILDKVVYEKGEKIYFKI
ncbi:MAG: hypothetical protein E7678_01295, partial [Ruminococcaceae bacterium]|nr:hypothetical protein [Oscillospiraceae bacterium]